MIAIIGLHCLSAFCFPATTTKELAVIAAQKSPLPFGFLLPGYDLKKLMDDDDEDSLHCLSAFCFPATRSH